jgi:hypothetical protein
MQQDIYRWCALDQNDEMLHEADANQGFASVKHAKLLMLIPLTDTATYHVAIPQDARPVFFRRRSIAISEGSSQHSTVHCIGWKRDDQSVYLFIFEDGSTLLTDNLQAV